jgi:hypothetical protein
MLMQIDPRRIFNVWWRGARLFAGGLILCVATQYTNGAVTPWDAVRSVAIQYTNGAVTPWGAVRITSHTFVFLLRNLGVGVVLAIGCWSLKPWTASLGRFTERRSTRSWTMD